MTTDSNDVIASLDSPFSEAKEQDFMVPGQILSAPGPYEESLKSGWELQQKPYNTAGVKNIMRQHTAKNIAPGGVVIGSSRQRNPDKRSQRETR